MSNNSKKPLYLKQYDLQPYLKFHFMDSDRVNIDVSSAVVRVNMYHTTSLTVVISRQTAGISYDGTSESAVDGKGHYAWQAGGDTVTPGLFKMELEITPLTGGKFTLPANDDYPILINITSGYDSV